MKKFLNLAVVASALLVFSACDIASDEEKDKPNIPTHITEKGFLGSWSHIGTDLVAPVIGLEWYIEGSQTLFVAKCEINGEIVDSRVLATTSISGSIFTVVNGEPHTSPEGCTVNVTAGAHYVLSLPDEKNLKITRSGATQDFTRINEPDDLQ
jgi:hypothetical protein